MKLGVLQNDQWVHLIAEFTNQYEINEFIYQLKGLIRDMKREKLPLKIDVPFTGEVLK